MLKDNSVGSKNIILLKGNFYQNTKNKFIKNDSLFDD